MGGNHFPCLLNKTIKRHYELASGKAFACHCLHLFKGVSVLSCFFSLFQNIIILLQSVREASGNTEANSEEEPISDNLTYVEDHQCFVQLSKDSDLVCILNSRATRNNLYNSIPLINSINSTKAGK